MEQREEYDSTALHTPVTTTSTTTGNGGRQTTAVVVGAASTSNSSSGSNIRGSPFISSIRRGSSSQTNIGGSASNCVVMTTTQSSSTVTVNRTTSLTKIKSGVLKLNLSSRHHQHNNCSTAVSPPIPSTVYKPVDDISQLRVVPATNELAFYVAVEACKEVKNNWDAVVKGYVNSCRTEQEVGIFVVR